MTKYIIRIVEINTQGTKTEKHIEEKEKALEIVKQFLEEQP